MKTFILAPVCFVVFLFYGAVAENNGLKGDPPLAFPGLSALSKPSYSVSPNEFSELVKVQALIVAGQRSSSKASDQEATRVYRRLDLLEAALTESSCSVDRPILDSLLRTSNIWSSEGVVVGDPVEIVKGMDTGIGDPSSIYGDEWPITGIGTWYTEPNVGVVVASEDIDQWGGTQWPSEGVVIDGKWVFNYTGRADTDLSKIVNPCFLESENITGDSGIRCIVRSPTEMVAQEKELSEGVGMVTLGHELGLKHGLGYGVELGYRELPVAVGLQEQNFVTLDSLDSDLSIDHGNWLKLALDIENPTEHVLILDSVEWVAEVKKGAKPFKLTGENSLSPFGDWFFTDKFGRLPTDPVSGETLMLLSDGSPLSFLYLVPPFCSSKSFSNPLSMDIHIGGFPYVPAYLFGLLGHHFGPDMELTLKGRFLSEDNEKVADFVKTVPVSAGVVEAYFSTFVE